MQCLANPQYLNFLAQQKTLDKPEFVAYLAYLQYFTEPKYAKFLQYVVTCPPCRMRLPFTALLTDDGCSHPGPTLRALELLQQERFRQDIINPGVMDRLIIEGQRNAVPPLRD